MSTSLRQQLTSYWQRIQLLEIENERLTRELAEARAQTRKAVRDALGDALITVSQSEGDVDFAEFKLRAMIARLEAEEPKE